MREINERRANAGKRAVRNAVVLGAAACLALGALAGCTKSGHQIVDQGQQCTQCHGEKTTYDDTAHSDAIHTNSTFTVKTSKADQVVVCDPKFTSSDGTAYTPIRIKNVPLQNGQATVTLDDGIYAICIDQGDSSIGRIVVVDASVSDSAEVTL